MQSAKWILKRIDYPGDIILSGKKEYTIGRGKSNYGTVLSLLVSRLHCVFRATENGLVIKDLNSSNGTYVNEQRIPANTDCILKVSDVIGIGVCSPKAADHFVFKLVNEDSNNIVCHTVKNEPSTERNSSRTEISPLIHILEEEEDENDEPLIIEQEIDVIDLIEDEDKTTAGSTIKSASSSLASHTNSGASFSLAVENRKTMCIKEEKIDTDFGGSERCVSGGKRTESRSVSCDLINLRENECRLKDIKIESEVETSNVVEPCNLEPKGLNSISANQCVVKVEKSTSSNVNTENNRVGKECQSFQQDISLIDLQRKNIPELKIKEEDISTHSASNSSKNRTYCNKEQQISCFDTTSGTKSMTEIGTSSKNVIIANVKQENVDKCKNSELSANVSGNIKNKDHSCAEKRNTCVSSSREEGSQKLACKRTHEDNVLSLPGSSKDSPRPASKRRKSSIDTDSSGSSTNSTSERCDSLSRLNLDVESENEDMWFNTFAVPILDQLEKTDVTKSVSINPPSGINSKRALVKNGTVTNVNSKRTRNAGTFILSEMQTLPAYLNPVIILKKFDLKKLQETRHDIKQETEISFDETLFEESLQLHTSTPKQGDLQQNNEKCHTTEDHNTSIINYSQSDDVIVIDDDDDDDFMDEGKGNKSLLQKDEDSEDVKEEICVKQEVFEEDEQVIEDGEEDDDEVELVNDWVVRLSQSSSPIIEDEIKPPSSSSGKLKKRSLFILDSDSSDEDSTSNLYKNVSVGKDIVNQNLDLNSGKSSKILFDDSLKNQNNEISLKSKQLGNNSVKEQSRIRNNAVDQNSKMSQTVKTNEDFPSENESDLSPSSAYADKLLESAFPAPRKKHGRKTSNSAEGSITKEVHENAKSSIGDPSRRTLLCSALPMKLKSRSKVTTESRDQKKASGFNSEVAKHGLVNELRITDLTRSKMSSNERKSKSSVHKNVDNSPVSEKELKMKVKEDRKAKLKALTEQKLSATTSNTETKGSSKSSNKSLHQNVVKNTTLSRADKLAESLAGSLQTKNHTSKSHKIKVRVIKKSNSGKSSPVPEDNSSYFNKATVINPVTSEVAAPKQTASEGTALKQTGSSGDKLDLDTPVSEVEMKIKKLSFKDVYKIPKLKQSNSSEPTKELHTATSAITNKCLNKPSALRNLAVSYPKKTVRFAPGESLCEVRTFTIEPGNILRRIDGKDIPVRKRMAEQAGILYDTSTKTLTRVTTAILRHWNPRWMTEQAVILRNGGEPPPAHCQNTPVSTLCPMLTAFSNYEEYLKIIDPLMMLDLWAKVSEDCNKPNQRMKRKYDITVLESKDANGIVTLNCSMPLKSKEEKEGLNLHVGDLCILRYPVWDHSSAELGHNMVASQQESFYERFAYIHSLTKDYRSTNNQNRWNTPGNTRQNNPVCGVMHLVIKVKGDSSLKVINASLRIISGIRTELRQFEAIGYLEHTKLGHMILNPRIQDFKIPCTDPNVKIVTEDTLNAAQRTAVMKGAYVCTHASPRICLIQGPPGTGKTQVILNIIKQVLYPNGHYSKARFDKKPRILLCAPSNAAADEMAERLLSLRTQMPKEKRFKMVRTGPLEYMRESVRGISLDELTKKEVEQVLPQQTQFESVELEIVTLEARKRSFVLACEYAASKNESTDMYKKRIQETEKRIADLRFSKKNVAGPKVSEIQREAKKKVLFHADIVVTTLTSSYSPQITEIFASRNGRNNIRFACCIIDEATQCTEPESLIPLMLGIERLVLVGDPEQLPATVLSQVAKTKSFGQSLFNRIWNKFQNETDNPIIFLNTQYRMHPEIYHWPNTYIYHGQVLTDPSCKYVSPLKPYCLFAHRFQQNSHNFVNSNEARLVLEIAMVVANSFHENVKTIGIITPYQQQLQEIKTCLDRSRTNNITVVVNTIDGFQGRECDVIIFSCVRTRGVGFMGESQRLNVALTRARHSLIICGNFVSLQEDKMWSSLLGDAMQRKVIVDLPNKTLNHVDVISYLLKYS